jgi:hypothetical protein
MQLCTPYFVLLIHQVKIKLVLPVTRVLGGFFDEQLKVTFAKATKKL